MMPPEDEILLRDMLDPARRAAEAVAGRRRDDLETDAVLAAATLDPGRARSMVEAVLAQIEERDAGRLSGGSGALSLLPRDLT